MDIQEIKSERPVGIETVNLQGVRWYVAASERPLRLELPKPWPEYAVSPPTIRELPVVKRSYLDRRHVGLDPVVHTVPVRAVAICHGNDERHLVYYCDINWNPLVEMSFGSLDVALASVESRYGRRGGIGSDLQRNGMRSWTAPNPEVIVTRAVIVECTISVDGEGPDFWIELAYGPNNRHSSRVKHGVDAYACQAVDGWSPDMLQDYYAAGRSIEVWYLERNPAAVRDLTYQLTYSDISDFPLPREVDRLVRTNYLLRHLASFNDSNFRFRKLSAAQVEFERAEALKELRRITTGEPGFLPNEVLLAIRSGIVIHDRSGKYANLFKTHTDGKKD